MIETVQEHSITITKANEPFKQQRIYNIIFKVKNPFHGQKIWNEKPVTQLYLNQLPPLTLYLLRSMLKNAI